MAMLSFSFAALLAFATLVLFTHLTNADHSARGYRDGHFPFHRRNTTAGIPATNLTLVDAQRIVSSFHDAMAKANAARKERPSGNNYTLYTQTDIEEAVKPAPYLEYDTINSTVAQTLRKRLLGRQLSNHTVPESGNSTSLSYTIPPEVAEAARVLAEANPPDTSSSEYDAIVAEMKERFVPKNNDTNAMPQVLQKASGLFEFMDNTSGDVSTPTSKEKPGLRRRIPASEFWMENIVQRGASPFAPLAYKVSLSHSACLEHGNIGLWIDLTSVVGMAERQGLRSSW